MKVELWSFLKPIHLVMGPTFSYHLLKISQKSVWVVVSFYTSEGSSVLAMGCQSSESHKYTILVVNLFYVLCPVVTGI